MKSISLTIRGSGVSASHSATWKMYFEMLAALLFCACLAGCGAARSSKYYQLTIPGDNNAADPPAANVYPVSLLVGPLNTSHLYREDHIVYRSGASMAGRLT